MVDTFTQEDNDTVIPEILSINKNKVRDFLLSKDAPVFEAELLKYAADISSLPCTTEELFSVHFSLFHALYGMKFDPDNSNYLLHIDPMRIRMLQLPEEGKCHHYFPEEGCFCGEYSGKGMYCDIHTHLYYTEYAIPSYDPLYEFYMNPDNIVFGTSDLLRKLMDGVVIYAFRQGEIQRSLEFFNITHPTSTRIQKRYHELAHKYHPDKNNGSENLMKELNRSYQVLKEVFVV